jgi:hypothetical protein
MFAVSRCMPVLFAFAVTGLLSGCGTAQVSSSARAAANDGSPASFTVVATGSAPLTYQWMQNNEPVPGGTGSTFRIAAVALADSGAQFSVIVRNNVGGVRRKSPVGGGGASWEWTPTPTDQRRVVSPEPVADDADGSLTFQI